MSLILVAESEGRHVERIRNALSGEGFGVRVVDRAEEALTVARAEPPRLALVASDLDQARRLFETFSRRTGGPGAIALVAERHAGDVTSQSLGADELVAKPFTDQDLRMAVRRVLSGATDAVPEIFADDEPEEPAEPAKQLTSEDIFGDLVAEFESDAAPQPESESAEEEEPAAETPPKPPSKRASQDLDRTLEQTLAGLRDLSAGPKKRRKKSRRRPLDDSDVDALLSETLSGLDLSRKRRPAKPAPRPEPEEPEEAPEAEATEPTPAPAAAAETSEASDREPAELEPADPRSFGQYELQDRIAVGGMAEVWKARMTGVEGFRKTVAIKRILSHLTGDEDFVRMFVDEAKLAAQLNHPNIIHIYDLGKIRDHYYIAMEYVEGMNLRGLLNATRKKGLPMPRGLALLVAARLASALDHAHRKKDESGRELGLVHRDVSPQNVLLSYEGDIKLCDFGIVKAVTKSSQTQMGALKGKLQYMSPEQAWGKQVDPRSDIFSLGALLFEMLTGRRLFGGDSEISVLEAVRQCRFTAPRKLDPTIPEPVEDIVLKVLEHDPDKRYATAGDLQHDLEELMYSLRPTPGPGDLAEFVRKLRDAPALEEPLEEPPAASSAELLHTPPESEAPAPEPAEESTSETPAAEALSELPEIEEELPEVFDTAGGDEPETEEDSEAKVLPMAEGAATVKIPVVDEAAETAETADAGGDAEDAEEAYETPPSEGGKALWIAAGIALLIVAALVAYYFLAVYTPSEPASLPPSAAAPVEPAAAETTGDADAASEAAGDETEADGETPAGTEGQGAAGADEEAGDEAAAETLQDVDLDALVEEELAKREAELRRQFEARERELARQIEEARAREAAAESEPPPSSSDASDASDDGAEGSGGS